MLQRNQVFEEHRDSRMHSISPFQSHMFVLGMPCLMYIPYIPVSRILALFFNGLGAET